MEATVKRWKKELDPLDEWLKYDVGDSGKVTRLRCTLCATHQMKLKFRRNFNSTFIHGITGAKLKKDNVKKHTKSDMHLTAMQLKKKPIPLSDVYNKTPLGRSLKKQASADLVRIGKLVDIAYLIAKKEKPFEFYPDLAEQEKRHGVDLGNTYINDKAAAEFTNCIAQVIAKIYMSLF